MALCLDSEVNGPEQALTISGTEKNSEVWPHGGGKCRAPGTCHAVVAVRQLSDQLPGEFSVIRRFQKKPDLQKPRTFVVANAGICHGYSPEEQHRQNSVQQ
jgi:hypothetical protein